jgi:hypothetical protein
MDNQNQQPEVPLSPSTPNTQPATPAQTPTAQATSKPQIEVSDAVAQSLLALNGVEGKPKTKLKLPIGLLISIAVVVVLAIAASYMLGGLKPAKNHSNTSTSSTSQNGDTQINNDVKSCSNVVNAVSEC